MNKNNPNIPLLVSQENKESNKKKEIINKSNPNIPPSPTQVNEDSSKKKEIINKNNPNIPLLVSKENEENTKNKKIIHKNNANVPQIKDHDSNKVSLKMNKSQSKKKKKSSYFIISNDKGNEFCQKNCIPNLKIKPKLCYNEGVKVCFHCTFNLPISAQGNHDANELCSKACRAYIGSNKCSFYSLFTNKNKKN